MHNLHPAEIFGGIFMRIVRIFLDYYTHNAHHVFMSSKEIIQKLAKAGFVLVAQKGSHQKWQHPDGRRVTVSHPNKDFPIKTVRSMEKQAGFTF